MVTQEDLRGVQQGLRAAQQLRRSRPQERVSSSESVSTPIQEDPLSKVTPSFLGNDELIGLLNSGNRALIAAELRGQAQAASEKLLLRENRNDQRLKNIVEYSNRAASEIEKGNGPLNNIERVDAGRARAPDMRITDLRNRYATGELQQRAIASTIATNDTRQQMQQEGYTGSISDYVSAQRAELAAQNKAAAMAQRQRFVMSQTPQRAQIGVQIGGKGQQVLITQGSKSKNAEELITKLSAPGAVFTPTLSYQVYEVPKKGVAGGLGNNSGVIVDVTGGKGVSGLIMSNIVSEKKEKPRQKVIFRETGLAPSVRKAGSFLAGLGESYFESGREVTPGFLRPATDFTANLLFRVGVKAESEPDRLVGESVVAGYTGNLIGKGSGALVSFMGRSSPVLAQSLERTGNVVLAASAGNELLAKPDMVLGEAPVLLAGASGYGKGYRVTNPAPVIRFGETSLKSGGTIFEKGGDVGLGQYGMGKTPVSVYQFGKRFRGTADTSVFATGGSSVEGARLKSNILVKNDFVSPTGERSSFVQTGKLISDEVGGQQFQLLSVEGMKPRVLVFDEPVSGVRDGMFSQEGSPLKVYGVNPVSGRVSSLREGFSNLGTLEVENSLLPVRGKPLGKRTTVLGVTKKSVVREPGVKGFLQAKTIGRQVEFSSNLVMNKKRIPVSARSVTLNTEFGDVVVSEKAPVLPSRKFFSGVLEKGRVEGVLPELPPKLVIELFDANDLLAQGKNVLLVGGGRRGSLSSSFVSEGGLVSIPKEVPRSEGGVLSPRGGVPEYLGVRGGRVTSEVVVGRPLLSSGSKVSVASPVLSARSVSSVVPLLSPVVVDRVVPRTVPGSLSRVVQKVIPETVPSVIPLVIPRSIPKVIPSVIPLVIPQVIPRVVPRVIPRTIPRTIPRVIPRMVTKITTQLVHPGEDSLLPKVVEDEKGGGLLVPGYRVELKRRGRFFKVAGGLSRVGALRVGSEAAKSTLGATFRIKATGGFVKPGKESVDLSGFRDYRVVGGKRVALRDEYIQLRSSRLSSVGEKREIRGARKGRFGGWV